MKPKANNIVIVTHKYVTHPDDKLVAYLNQKKRTVMHICHSFYDIPNRRSYYQTYEQGKKEKYHQSIDYKFLIEPLIYIKEIIYSFLWIFFSPTKYQTYIGMDGLCVFVGIMLKKLGKVDKTIYWAIDFVPENRFNSAWKNSIYHLVNKFSYTHASEVWDLSPRMKEARSKYLGLKDDDYQKIKVVPYGMWVNQIKHVSYKNCDKNTIVFLGHLKESQGLQNIIKVLPKISEKFPKINLKIVGSGPYESSLKRLTKKLDLEDRCYFLGRIDSHSKVEEEIAKACISVAPYSKKLDKWTYYADPGKIKTYLACGVPVVMTDLPWNSQDIKKQKAGIITNESHQNLIKSISLLLDPVKNTQYRKNAIKYAQQFDYTHIFKGLDI